MFRFLSIMLGVLMVMAGDQSRSFATEAVDPNGPPPPFDAPEETMLPLPDGGAGAWYTGVYNGAFGPNYDSVSYTTTILPDLLLYNETHEFVRLRPIYRASNYTVMTLLYVFPEGVPVRHLVDFVIFSLRSDGKDPMGLSISDCYRSGLDRSAFEWPTAKLYEAFLSHECPEDFRKTIAAWRESTTPGHLFLPSESRWAQKATVEKSAWPLPTHYHLPFHPDVLDRVAE